MIETIWIIKSALSVSISIERTDIISLRRLDHEINLRVMSSAAKKNCSLFYSLFARCQSLAGRFVNVNLSGWVIYMQPLSHKKINATWSFKYGYRSFSLAVSCPWPYLILCARVRLWASLSSERSPINLGQIHPLRLVKGMLSMRWYKATLL